MSVLNWLQTWDTAIGAIGSIILTLMLVILYAKQQGLLKRELNREVRMKHTETLKKRVREWHGDIDEIGLSDDPEKQLSDTSNLPKVKPASIEPAPAIFSVIGEDEFRVIPEIIEDDRYLKDLLENHAPELRELKESIERLNDQIEIAKTSFLEEYSGGPVIDDEDYKLTPLEYYSEWVFERAVRIHRDFYETSIEREKDLAKSRIQGVNQTGMEPGTIHYSPVSEGGRSTYKAEYASGDLTEIEEFEAEVENQLVKLHHQTIDSIDQEGAFLHTVKAANKLDDVDRAVEELRAKLVEHEGHPLYADDCPYVADAVL